MGLTFLELVTRRKDTCGSRKWTEHYLVLEGRHIIRNRVWRRPVAELWNWRSFCVLRKCIKWKALSAGGVVFASPRPPSFIKFWSSMPSGCQTRRKIFESTSLSKVPKSPGLSLLSCAILLAQSTFQSPRNCHLTCWLHCKTSTFYSATWTILLFLIWVSFQQAYLTLLLLNVTSKSSLLSRLSSLVIILWLPMEKGKGVWMLCNESSNFFWQVRNMLRFSFNLARERPIWIMNSRESLENGKNRGCHPLASCWDHLVPAINTKCYCW